VSQQRSGGWYVAMIAVLLLLTGVPAALAIFGIFDWLQAGSTIGLMIVVFVSVIVVNKRKPREVNYALTDEGLFIEDRLRPFGEFRSFGVARENDLWAVILVPTKRFGLAVTIYIPEDRGERIVDLLGAHLPMTQTSASAIDKLSSRFKV
jgi:hypothetical protein